VAKKKVKTKAEKERLQTIAEMPCYACFQDGLEVSSEVHHIRSHTGIGLKSSDFMTIPLCPRHHRYGKVSVHLGKVDFEKRYGTQKEILKKVNREIERCKRQIVDIF